MPNHAGFGVILKPDILLFPKVPAKRSRCTVSGLNFDPWIY
ncbi:hypothetical protein Z947_2127 [Sulfitobacter geojensis]|nr:hypothetical protein Z947_2127 [Sulfitobacter geojensis]